METRLYSQGDVISGSVYYADLKYNSPVLIVGFEILLVVLGSTSAPISKTKHERAYAFDQHHENYWEWEV